MEIPDLIIEVLATTALFIILELTVIIPLIKKAFKEQVDSNMIPTMKSYINTTIDSFKDGLVPTISAAVGDAANNLWLKIRGRRGGSKKGVNSFVDRVLDGEDPDEIAQSYTDDVVSSGLSILEAVADRIKARKEKTEAEEEQPAGGFLTEVS